MKLSEMFQGWPAVAWGQGSGAWPGTVTCPEALATEGTRRPEALGTGDRAKTETGGWASRSAPWGGGGVGGRGSSISTNPNYWGAPSLGREQIAVLKKGCTKNYDRWISTSQNNLEANPGVARCTYGWRWRLKELGLLVRPQQLPEGGLWMPVRRRNGWAGSGGKAMGRGVRQRHSMSYYEDGEQGEAIRRMRTLPSLFLLLSGIRS